MVYKEDVEEVIFKPFDIVGKIILILLIFFLACNPTMLDVLQEGLGTSLKATLSELPLLRE